MSTDSERCVDDLLKKLTVIDNIIGQSSGGQLEQLELADKEYKSLQNFIDNNRTLIPSYCLKKAVDSLKNLESFINNPKQTKVEFKFKSERRVDSNPQEKEALNVGMKSSEILAQQAITHPPLSRTLGFSNKINEILSLDAVQVDSTDISLTQLKNCQVNIEGIANTVYISGLEDTIVYVGIARRAITVKNCTNCKFKLVCQQLRIDSTNDCKFEIFTSARSMLESSNGLEFKCINTTEKLRDLMVSANFKINKNNWNCIDDFDWLSPNIPSKHFKLIEADEDPQNN